MSIYTDLLQCYRTEDIINITKNPKHAKRNQYTATVKMYSSVKCEKTHSLIFYDIRFIKQKYSILNNNCLWRNLKKSHVRKQVFDDTITRHLLKVLDSFLAKPLFQMTIYKLYKYLEGVRMSRWCSTIIFYHTVN